MHFRVSSGANVMVCNAVGDLTVSSSSRAPLFYDSNDTAYYINPNGTSVINQLNLNGPIVRTATGQGYLNGNYPTTETVSSSGAIYSIGGVYVPGSTTLSNMYGVGYAYSGSGHAVGTNPAGAPVNAWGLYGATAGTLRWFLDATNGGGYFNGQVNAPIFYDSNNTAYYVDPNSTASASFAGYIGLGGNSYTTGMSGTTGVSIYATYPAIGFQNGVSPNSLIYKQDAVLKVWNSSASDFVFFEAAGYTRFGGSARAPIFYDSDDTGYYVDPNGTSNLNKFSALTMSYNDMNSMHVNSPYVTRYAASASYRNGTMGYGAVDFNTIFSNWGSGFIDSWSSPTNAPGGSTHYVGMQGQHGTSQDSANVYGFQMLCAGEANNRFFWRSAWPTIASRSWVEMIHTSNINSLPSDLRAPQFYDRDDTGYYIDPNSTSSSALRMRGGALFGPNATWGQYLYIGTNGNIDVNTATVAVTNGNLHLDARNGYVLYLNNYATSSYTLANQSMRSPIFYDSDNTGYYVDGNSTARLGTVNADVLRSYNNVYIDNNYGFGVIGVYSSYQLQGVFAMGSAYTLPADGSTGGSLYGICWSHPNAGSKGGANNLASHGMLILENGTFKGAWGGGSLRTPGDIRGTLFYDYDNTGYYWEPNGTSNVNTTVLGTMYFRANRDTNSSSAPLQAYSNDGGGATMAFHRSGYYAINFGLDSDNVIRFGGWSAATNRLQMDMSGNLTMAGNVTAYSDIRLKENIEVITNALHKVKQIRGVTFTRNDTEHKEQRHAGVIAQEVELVLPEVVATDNSGIKNVAYGNMVALLIEAVKEQQIQIEKLNQRIDLLEAI
jgi:hypothetical protein